MITLDTALRMWIVTHRVAVLDPIFVLLSAIGRGGLVWLAIAAAIAIARRQPRAFVLVVVAVVIASVATDHVIKPLVGRRRPYETLSGTVIDAKPDDASFPSGHSANAFAAATTLAWVVPQVSWLWWTLAAAIAVSRVYVGVHFPLDVIAGALVGVAAAWLSRRLTRFPQL